VGPVMNCKGKLKKSIHHGTLRRPFLPNNRNSKVPFSAKVWWAITWVIMIVLMCLLWANLHNAVVFGTKTGGDEISIYRDAGFADAISGEKTRRAGMQTDNPLLKKAYNKGFREGLDKNRQERSK